MVNDTAPPPNTISQSDKMLAVQPSITTLIPVKLDVTKANYSSWCFFFKNQCEGLEVLDHIERKEASSSAAAVTPPTTEWLKVDSLLKSWIFLTCSDVMVARLVKANPKTALDAWTFLENIFLDNKRTKTVALHGELRLLTIGDMTVDAYFAKIESISTLLADLGSPMHDDDLVTYALNGLSDRFTHVAGIIAHRNPFPNLDTVRSMVTTEDLRLKHKATPSNELTHSSAPTVLLAETSTRDSRPCDTRGNSSQNVCRHFARTGLCKWGNGCRFLHGSTSKNHARISHQDVQWSRQPNVISSGNGQNLASMGQAQLVNLVQAQQRLLAQYGLANNITPAQRVLQAQQQQFHNSRPHNPPPTPLASAHFLHLRPTSRPLFIRPNSPLLRLNSRYHRFRSIVRVHLRVTMVKKLFFRKHLTP
ncbi:hybrid signal transduction histidine kinase M [Artemisia annua]|uniref:Hybrid signal transduction histidine kinase M n=1 Tax=Artemisia annua TaxID=35608 RepID=A0A2U1QAD9_ARTAN|nr:hybrid signal transduction histidine kinase M [Artemisia annua]